MSPPFNFTMPSVHMTSYLVQTVAGVMAYDAMIVPIACRFICGPPSGSDFTALACHHDEISNYQMSFCMNWPIMAAHVPSLFENTFMWTQYTVIIQMLICADNRAHSKWKVGCMLKTFRLICTLPPFLLNFKACTFFVNTIMPVRPPEASADVPSALISSDCLSFETVASSTFSTDVGTSENSGESDLL